MTLHPNGSLVASGQRATQGHRLTANVQVWDSRTLRTLHVLGDGELGGGILALDFSTRVREMLLVNQTGMFTIIDKDPFCKLILALTSAL